MLVTYILPTIPTLGAASKTQPWESMCYWDHLDGIHDWTQVRPGKSYMCLVYFLLYACFYIFRNIFKVVYFLWYDLPWLELNFHSGWRIQFQVLPKVCICLELIKDINMSKIEECIFPKICSLILSDERDKILTLIDIPF